MQQFQMTPAEAIDLEGRHTGEEIKKFWERMQIKYNIDLSTLKAVEGKDHSYFKADLR